MAILETEADIAAAPSKVFAALADVERAVDWVPSLVESKLTTPGPLAVGARYHQERTVMRTKRDPVDLTVLDLSAPTTLVLDAARNGKQTAVITWNVSPSGAGSRVRYTMDLKMGAAIAFLWGGTIRKQMAGDLEGLKRHLEGTAATAVRAGAGAR